MQFPKTFFRVRGIGHPGFLVLNRDQLKEAFNAGDELHFMSAAVEDTDFRYTFSSNIFERAHTDAIRIDLNRNLPKVIVNIADELNLAMRDELDQVVSKGNIAIF